MLCSVSGWRTIAGMFLLGACLIGCSAPHSTLIKPEDNYGEKACKKLGRGVVNIVSAPLEPLNQGLNYAGRHSSFPEECAGFGAGLFIGILWWMPARVVTGALDIVLFFIPPFDPLLRPEFIRSEVKLGLEEERPSSPSRSPIKELEEP